MNMKRWIMAVMAAAFAIGTARATTYTWTKTATGTQDWTAGANWASIAPFVSESGNELKFFADITTTLPTSINQTINNVPTALSMNTLTLNGKGPNDTAGFRITIGDNTSTWTIGDGTTSTVNLNSTLGGGTSDRDVRYTILPNLTLNQTTTTFTGNSTSITGARFSGNITEAAAGYGITKSGSSLLVFSGNNTYTGPTTVSGGTLRLLNESSLPGGMGGTGGTTALTLNGCVLELGGVSLLRNLGTGSSEFRITGGTVGFSAVGAPVFIEVNNDAATEMVWDSSHFAPSTLVLNAATANNSLWLANKVDLNSASARTIQVDANVAILPGVIRNTAAGGLTKTGGGMLVLTGNNTYNGATTISVGTLSVGAASNLGSGSSGLILNGGGLKITGTALSSITSLGHTVTFNNNAKAFDIQDASHTFTVDQVLSGTTLTKSGVGTLVLNQDNTFSDTTTATGGGTLVLDYTTNNGSKLKDTKALTLSGSALVLKGGSHTELVSATTLTANTSSSISRDGGSAKISLGAITAGGNATLGISEANLATTTSGSGGMLSMGRVTVGSHFGANDSSGNIVAYSGYTTATTAGGLTTATVNQLTGGGTMTNTLSSYALRIVNSGSSDVLELGSKSLSLINNSTFLYGGGFDNNYTINGSGAITSASGNQYFTINIYTGCTLTLNAKSSSNYAPVSKAGQGTLVFGGNNSTLGTMYVQEGVLRVTHKDGLGPTSGGTIVRGGAALELSNNISIGAEALTLSGAGISNGGALRNVSGNNSYAGAITIVEGGARIIAASGSLTLTGGITTTGGQNITLGGAGDIIVSNAVVNGAANLVKDGAGKLELAVTASAVQSTCGDLALNGGALEINFIAAPNATVAPLKIMGNLTGTPALKISAIVGLFTSGVSYPLLTVGGSKPETLPTVELVGVTGTLKWVGKTLFLASPPQGTLISFR